MLKQESGSPSDVTEMAFGQSVDPGAAEPDLARFGLQQADHEFEHDALACTAWTQDDGCPARYDIEIHTIKDGWAVKSLVHISEGDQRLWLGMRISPRHAPAPYHPLAVTTRTIAREPLLEGRIFTVERCSWNDGDGCERIREVVRHPGAVTIVPVLDDGRLVLVRNWRIAVGGPLWELPAGKREPGEPPIETAARELAEETGYSAGTLTAIGTYYTSPGFADELMHAYVATDMIAGSPCPEPGEEVVAEAFTMEQVDSMIADGTFIDGKSLAAILLWRRAEGDS